MADREHHEPATEADIAEAYARQARLTRTVGRGLLMFGVVWVPALLIVPAVFKTGAILSLALATIAAVSVMIVIEHSWMKPRAAARERDGHRPPPPRGYESAVRRLLRDARDRVQR